GSPEALAEPEPELYPRFGCGAKGAEGLAGTEHAIPLPDQGDGRRRRRTQEGPAEAGSIRQVTGTPARSRHPPTPFSWLGARVPRPGTGFARVGYTIQGGRSANGLGRRRVHHEHRSE